MIEENKTHDRDMFLCFARDVLQRQSFILPKTNAVYVPFHTHQPVAKVVFIVSGDQRHGELMSPI